MNNERDNCTNCIYHRKATRLENYKWIQYSCCVYDILNNPKLIDKEIMLFEEYDKTKKHFHLCECFVDIDKVKELKRIIMNNKTIGTCGECKHWHTSEKFMDKYGQGCGQCSLSFGDEYGITFCSHQCFMCERKEENENVK